MRSVSESYRGRNVRVFRLDQTGTVARLAERARSLLESEPDVLAVWLFGSLARGEAVPGSDADLYAVVRDDASAADATWLPIARAFSGLGIGCDLLVHSAREHRERADRGDPFVTAVLREGRPLAARGDPEGAGTGTS